MTCEAHVGLACQDIKQSDRNCNQDYRVRFLAPFKIPLALAVLRTVKLQEWLDRDNLAQMDTVQYTVTVKQSVTSVLTRYAPIQSV